MTSRFRSLATIAAMIGALAACDHVRGADLDVKLVKDIVLGDLTIVGDEMFFGAFDEQGRELWKTDGTEAGTVRVKDIRDGTGSSFPSRLKAFHGQLFFAAEPTGGDQEPWISDGTEEGTVLIKDIIPGTKGSLPDHYTPINNELFFPANDGVHGTELWKNDGTEEGTMLVTEIFPGSEDPQYTAFNEFAVFNNELYSTGYGLWKVVPEPAVISLIGLGGLMTLRRRR